MRSLDLSLQQGWMRRAGVRGRWVTAYLHRYAGKTESTERLHTHPWRLCLGIVLRGWLEEAVGEGEINVRRFLSVRFYTASTRHRVARGRATTLFIGLGRKQVRGPADGHWNRVGEGLCHYTELASDEPGFRPDIVEDRAQGPSETTSPVPLGRDAETMLFGLDAAAADALGGNRLAETTQMEPMRGELTQTDPQALCRSAHRTPRSRERLAARP